VEFKGGKNRGFNMKIWRALIIHPNDDYNCGDQLTYYGTKSLLTQAVGGTKYLDVVQFDHRRAVKELNTYITEFHWGNIDIIALAGSPWLWNGCEKSEKYKILVDACNRWPEAKKVALGVGSCFSQKCFNGIYYGPDDYFFNHPPRQVALFELYKKFNVIVVRDLLAKFIFDKLGIASFNTFDTSIYSYHTIGLNKVGTGTRKALFFYNPHFGVSSEELDFNNNDYVNYQIEWAAKNNATIFVNSAEDLLELESRKIDANFSVDLKFLFAQLSECDELLTGRVHMGVLGKLAGVKNVTVIPVDTRFLTAEKFDVNIHYIGKPYNFPKFIMPPTWENILSEEQKIVQLIKDQL
jgi:hypothetical protein